MRRVLVGIGCGVLGALLLVPGLALTALCLLVVPPRNALYKATRYCLGTFRFAFGGGERVGIDRSAFVNRAAYRRWKARRRR